MPILQNTSIQRLTLAQRFMLASLVILIAGMVGIGLWVSNQITTGVIHRTGATTALYVDSFVTPLLQDFGNTGDLSPEYMDQLSKLLQDTPLGQQIVAFKVWDPAGRVLYSTDQETVGKTFPMHGGLLRASQGEVSSQISQLEEAENAPQKAIRSELLETYSPVRLSGTNQIIAIAEFYQTIDDLSREVAAAQRRSWLVVGGAMLVIYLLLAGFVRRASDTIESQRSALNLQISQLTALLSQNKDLHDRVRRAAASVTTLNERFLRRIGSELHDGPSQDLGLVLLKLDALIDRGERTQADPQVLGQLTSIQASLQNALKEIRGISTGLSLPQLADLSLAETVIRAVRAHERRTGSRVDLELAPLPEQVALPVKITVYRVLQEALNNAYRHAEGTSQQTRVFTEGDQLVIEVSDQGPGFETAQLAVENGHLGLAGMRERVESLGGQFLVESAPGKGTRLTAKLSLKPEEDSNER